MQLRTVSQFVASPLHGKSKCCTEQQPIANIAHPPRRNKSLFHSQPERGNRLVGQRLKVHQPIQCIKLLDRLQLHGVVTIARRAEHVGHDGLPALDVVAPVELALHIRT